MLPRRKRARGDAGSWRLACRARGILVDMEKPLTVTEFARFGGNARSRSGRNSTYTPVQISGTGSIQPIAGTDVATFVVIEPPQNCGTGCRFNAEDSHHRYFEGFIVQRL